MECTIGKNGCRGYSCTTCGMNSEEMERRKKLLHTNGLKRNPKGLYYLNISHKTKRTTGEESK